MCGYTGIIDKKGVFIKDLMKMTMALRHRGPDDEGYLLVGREGDCRSLRGEESMKGIQLPQISTFQENSNFSIGLGHRRLSIIDLSLNGHQPMQLDSLYIIYNGEIYNYVELRNELVSLGRKFRTATDTEVILHSYQQWGPDCATHFIGMWSFAIVDAKNLTIFFSRDRYGIKPLYYYIKEDVFAFSSEIKSLFCYAKIKKEIAEKNLISYLNRGVLNECEETLFKNVFEVPAGKNAFFDFKTFTFQMVFYYLPIIQPSKQFPILNEEESFEQYGNLLKDSIRLNLRSDVIVGSCLSGGLDSSAITAYCAKSNSNQEFNTITAAYDQTAIDETYYAKKVIDFYPNIKAHFTYPLIENIWPNIERIIWHQDLPVNSSSIFAQWEVMSSAKKNNLKVLLDGQGADEVLGGYSYFAGIFLLELLKDLRFKEFHKQKIELHKKRAINSTNEIIKAIVSLMPNFIENSIRKYSSLGNRVLRHSFVKAFDKNGNIRSNVASFNDATLNSIKYGLKELLRYEDRNSMAHSIESRVPFLDHRLVNYSINLPIQYKVRDGWTKFPIRKFLVPIAPSEIAWRRDKKGFITPQLEWKNKSLEYIMDILSSSQLPTCFNSPRIKEYILSRSLSNKQLSEYWRLISVLVWVKVNELSS